MTDVPVRGPVDPCPPEEPLAWDELDPQSAALRTLLAVLADTGAVVTFPVTGWLPEPIPLAVACGWMLRPDFTADRENGRMLLSCEHVQWWPGERPATPQRRCGGVVRTSGNK